MPNYSNSIAYGQQKQLIEQCGWGLIGNDYASISWGGKNKPTQELLNSLANDADLFFEISQHNAEMTLKRQEAYRNISDPLMFKWQRGEVTQQEWLDAVASIKARYPMRVMGE